MLTKITHGFVTQVFDPVKQEFVGQEFVAGDECEYEDKNGFSIDSDEFEDESGVEAYLPFNMLQPAQQKAIYDLLEYGQCGIPNSIWKDLKDNFPI